MRVLMVCPELPSAENPGSMAPAARQIDSIRQTGVDVDVVDMRGVPKLKYLQVLPRIVRLAAEADLVHAHFGYCGWLASLAQSKPLVISFMGDDLLGTPSADGSLERFSRVMVAANRRLARRARRVIVKSEEMATVIAPTPCSVIPNGVDTDRFRQMSRSECRQRLRMPGGLKVLFPGNPENPRKGWSIAKLAVNRASKMLGHEIDLVPLWNVPPDDVPSFMNACDAMVMTSLIEGSPNVVKEALACNLPVVGVPVGDVHSMLSNVTGCFCCERDADAIALQLSKAVLIEGCRGRDAIRSRGLDLASVANRVIAVYEQALSCNDFSKTEASGEVQPCVE